MANTEPLPPTSEIEAPIEADSFKGSGSDISPNRSDAASTVSTSSDVWQFREENGRTYHGYRAGAYHYPNDTPETERLDYQHWILDFALHGQLHFAPLSNPFNILDVGTGTGTWAIQMGDAYPGATIEATDLSPIQPNDVPANVRFIVDDAELDDWAIPENHYDFIHTRLLMGCMEDFSAIIEHGFLHTKPGGWMESQDVMMGPFCDDNTMPDDWPFKEWSDTMAEAAEMAGRPLLIADKLKQWYIDAGFVDVHEKVVKIPINSWPRDKHFKDLGSYWAEDILAGLQGFSLALFSRIFGWSKTEIEVYLVNVRKAISDTRVHSYNKYYIVWGRKPEPSSNPNPSAQNHVSHVPMDPVDIPLPPDSSTSP